MSIRDRLHDAAFLLNNGRLDGALLSALIAAAATSRKRYPYSVVNYDREAFVRFLTDENPVLFTPSPWIPKSEDDYLVHFDPKHDRSKRRGVGGLWITPQEIETEWPDNSVPLAFLLYKYIRSNLVHEAKLPVAIWFYKSEDSRALGICNDGPLSLSDTFISRLVLCSQYAPENADEFPDLLELPNDVAGWFLFNKSREKHEEYLAKRADRLAAVKAHINASSVP